MPNETVEYAAVSVDLRRATPPIELSKNEVKECCKAMQVMARGVVFAHDTTVEIERRPDLIIKDITTEVDKYPENERTGIKL